MDALRLERLVWAFLVGLVVATPPGSSLAPDPTGSVRSARRLDPSRWNRGGGSA